jgi:Flp pilus assembly pilin Flp
MVEYGLMVVLIALVVIIAVNPLGTAVSSLFDTSRQSL